MQNISVLCSVHTVNIICRHRKSRETIPLSTSAAVAINVAINVVSVGDVAVFDVAVCASHRRWIKLKDKAKVVAFIWVAKFVQFLAALAVLLQSIWKNCWILRTTKAPTPAPLAGYVRYGLNRN